MKVRLVGSSYKSDKVVLSGWFEVPENITICDLIMLQFFMDMKYHNLNFRIESQLLNEA